MTKIKDYIRGDSRNITVTFLQSDGVTPIDLTGGTVFFTVNATQNPTDDTSAAIAKKVTSFTSPTSGVATISLTNADTQNIAPGTYYYDVQLKDASGNFVSSKQDQFIVIADTTRSTS